MVSIVSPAYNNPREVALLLRNIAERCTGEFEVIIVDDGSTAQQLADVCAKYPFTRYIRLEKNGGASHARNVGARAARYELILFLDSDVVVLGDAVQITIRRFADRNVVAGVGAVEAIPANPGSFQNFWGLLKTFSLPRDSYSSTFCPFCGPIRRNVFESVGGFDENFRGASVEDYEFSIRLSARGWRVHYMPEMAFQTHYKDMRRSLGQSFARAAKWVLLFRSRPHFDNHTTTRGQAIGTLAGSAMIALVPLMLVDPRMAILAGSCGVAYFYVNGPFFRYVAKVAGLAFVPMAIFFHLLLSATVTLGAFRGFMQLPLGEARRKELLYR